MKIVILTDIPSPYQVELFNALATNAKWSTTAIYARRSASERSWETPQLLHEHFFLEETTLSELVEIVTLCDLAVFGGYRPSKVAHLMHARNRTGNPWAFWGERPGFRFPGWFGRQYRAWALREVHSSEAAIWGIGEWAVDGYRSEIRGERRFFNVPYFSNLASFLAIPRAIEINRPCRFLFSGSFIHRKGIDVLTEAFGRLSAEGIDARLHLLGNGPLKADIEKKCSSFSDKVVMHGFVRWDQLASVYAQADVLCAPSRHDGWGLVVVEGLAAGMPVISTSRTGAARELIDTDTGWLVPTDDVDALFSAMKSAATLDNHRFAVMSQRARQASRQQNIEAGATRFFVAAEKTLRSWRNKKRSIG